MLVRRSLPGYKAPFNLDDFWVVLRRNGETPAAADAPSKEMQAEAMVKVRVYRQPPADDTIIQTAADGNGPVNALDAAVRKALAEHYPAVQDIRLVDYKVRVIDTAGGTGANVRVLIDCAHDEYSWQTVGASTDIIEASWLALADAYQWWLLRHPE
jgi:2-isopropylmalate synthase